MNPLIAVDCIVCAVMPTALGLMPIAALPLLATYLGIGFEAFVEAAVIGFERAPNPDVVHRIARSYPSLVIPGASLPTAARTRTCGSVTWLRASYLNLGRLLRTSRNSLGPLRSRRLRRCRSSSVADGSIRRSISWPAIARAFSALSVRTPARWALGPCSVAMIDLHSSQTMSAASWSFLSFAFIMSNIIGCVLLQVGHQTRENRASTSMF